MSWKKILGLSLLGSTIIIPLVVWAFFVKAIAPNVGEQAVLVDKPILFGHEGVREKPVDPGRTYVWWTTDHITVNMQPRQYVVHFDDLMSMDGVPLDFDSALRLQVLDSVKLVRNFGVNWYEKNVEAEFRNRVRQAVRKHGMNETAIDTTAIDAIDREVSQEMERYLESAGLPVKLIQVTVGKANPPDSIKNQRIETAAQQQRILSEKERKKAEDERKNAETSRAAADNAYRQAMSLSPEQFLQLEQIKMLREVGNSGKATLIMSGGVMPTVEVGKK